MKPSTNPTNMGMAIARALGGSEKPPEDILMDLATQAWAKWSSLDGAGARTDYIRAALRHDPTWTLVEQYASGRVLTDAISRLLNDAREKIAAQQPRKKARVLVEAHTRGAPGSNSIPGGHGDYETQEPAAARAGRKSGQPDSVTHRTAAALATLADKHAAAANARAEVEIRLADRILLNGKPLRRCTVSEVRAWAEARQRDARTGWRDYLFGQHLIANLRGDQVIGDNWRDNEIETLYARAGADYAVAAA